jgi:prevent-host-death family protein
LNDGRILYRFFALMHELAELRLADQLFTRFQRAGPDAAFVPPFGRLTAQLAEQRLFPISSRCATMTHMKSVGIRILQQNAAAILREVSRGVEVEVTERGRPVARLVPVAAKDTIGFLESVGSLRRARKDLLALGEPLPVPKRGEPASRRLARMRSHER